MKINKVTVVVPSGQQLEEDEVVHNKQPAYMQNGRKKIGV